MAFVSSSNASPLSWKTPDQKPLIYIENVSKIFGQTKALDNITLSIYRQEFFSLLGGSGCGKTTLLRLLGGFEKPDSGKIYVDGIDVSNTPLYELPINMVFQSYALFPHMTVWANIAFPLKRMGLGRTVIAKRVQDMLHLVHLKGFADRKPASLSGGQQQRVALARALASEPKVLLLDEPLGALDKSLREKTQFELVNIQEKVGATFVMVTHDQEEAMTMSSRIGVMEKGKILQVGTPGEVYEYPNSLYVGQFIGSTNIFRGSVTDIQNGNATIACPDLPFPLQVSYSPCVPLHGQACVIVRPEKIMMAQEPFKSSYNVAKGIVKDIAYLGDVSIYHVQLSSGKTIMATQPNIVRLAQRPVTWESQVFLGWDAENSLMLAL